MKQAGENGGIYAIKADDEILYIGMALTDLQSRYKQHKTGMKMEPNKHLYAIMRQKKEEGCYVHFTPLIKIKELYTNGTIDERELEAMELALIHVYQPIGNIEGIDKKYIFSRRAEEIGGAL